MTIKILFPGGKTSALTFSYDDGVVEDLRLLEIFRRNGLKATFHLNSGLFGTEGRLPDIGKISGIYAGHEVACHGFSHPYFNRLGREELLYEIMHDREELEKHLHAPVNGMSYPFGTYTADTLAALKSCGIVYSRTVKSTGGFELPEDFLCWHPTCHHDGAMALVERFQTKKRPLELFYIWGHAYEFERQNKWEYMEKLCSELSNLDHVWYATNIEIYRYVTALKMLFCSVDRRSYRNDSGQDIFLSVDGEVFRVPAGGTLRLG